MIKINALSKDMDIGNNQILFNEDKVKLLNSQIIFSGENNKLYIDDDVTIYKSKIHFVGNNNYAYLSKNCFKIICNLNMTDNSEFFVGKDVFFNHSLTCFCSEEKNIYIGDECLLANGIFLRTADPHLIFDCTTKQRISIANSIILGDHVWIGQESKIFKGTYIGSGSIIGAGSVVSNKMIESNSVYGGAPIKKIRDNIFWLKDKVRKWGEKEIKKYSNVKSENYIFCKDSNSLDFDQVSIKSILDNKSHNRLAV